MDYLIRPAEPHDRHAWRSAFTEYAGTGEVAVKEETLERVWGWILDPSCQTQCHLAVAGDQILGLVHFRQLERPLFGDFTGYIDDLFVTPGGRSQGIGRGLMAHVIAYGARHGWGIVRWTTKPTNEAANHLYGKFARIAPVSLYVADIATPGENDSSDQSHNAPDRRA